MSHIAINPEQFPNLIPENAKVGDQITLTVTGVIKRIEADLIDVTPLGAPPAYTLGSVEIETQITQAERT